MVQNVIQILFISYYCVIKDERKKKKKKSKENKLVGFTQEESKGRSNYSVFS